MVEIILPKEHFGFFFIGREAYIASQSFAIHLDVAAIQTLDSDLPIAFVNDAELCALALVASMSVVEKTVRVAYSRTIRGFVDDAESLAKGDVPAAIGLGFLHRKVVKLSVATVLSTHVESEQSVA